MEKIPPTVFTDDTTLNTVCDHIRNVANLQVFGGCTQNNTLPEKSLTIKNVNELSIIEKKERYIEFGPGVTLGRILQLGRNNIPEILYDAIESIATVPIRNIATIGGNICASMGQQNFKQTLWAPLTALGAILEIKNVQKSNKTDVKHIPFTQFTELDKGTIITKIKVPLYTWDISIFRRLGPSHYITAESASFAFLAEIQKDILVDLRIIFAGPIMLNLNDIITQSLTGIKLPLKEKQINTFIEMAAEKYDKMYAEEGINPIIKAQLLNLLKNSFGGLS